LNYKNVVTAGLFVKLSDPSTGHAQNSPLPGQHAMPTYLADALISCLLVMRPACSTDVSKPVHPILF
jgi:hypothetical protein